MIATHFLQRLCLQSGRAMATLTPAAADYLKQQRWNGNVRELRNVVERALLFSSSAQITERELTRMCGTTISWQANSRPGIKADQTTKAPPERHSTRSSVAPCKTTCSENTELERLRNALEQTRWNKTKTAEILQWSRMTIYRKILQYDLQQFRNIRSTRSEPDLK